MAKTEQYDSEITELEGQIEAFEHRLGVVKQLKAEALCPHKVGDEIVNKKGDRRAKITAIRSDWDDYKMLGYWFKKDGTLGTQLRQLYWLEWG